MSKTLTTNELEWDSRPFSLTLAGCLVIAGMPLAAEAVAEVKPKTTEEIMNDPERVSASASCRVCQLANIYGCPSCHDENCPNPLPQASEPEQRPEAAASIREPFHVTDEKSANWYLRKLANIEAEKARIKAQSEKMLADLDSDRDGLKFLYEGELQEFVRAELTRRGGRKKTLHLLQASCSFRSVKPSLKLADPAAAFTHAKENVPAAVETIERLNNAEYAGIAELLYKEFKTLLPGIERTEARESFSVKYGGKPDPE